MEPGNLTKVQNIGMEMESVAQRDRAQTIVGESEVGMERLVLFSSLINRIHPLRPRSEIILTAYRLRSTRK